MVLQCVSNMGESLNYKLKITPLANQLAAYSYRSLTILSTQLAFSFSSLENTLCALLCCSTMSAKSAISKEIFAPLDERMLGAVQVKRRTKKKIPFLATGGQGEYLTYICLSGNENQTIILKHLHLKIFYSKVSERVICPVFCTHLLFHFCFLFFCCLF